MSFTYQLFPGTDIDVADFNIIGGGTAAAALQVVGGAYIEKQGTLGDTHRIYGGGLTNPIPTGGLTSISITPLVRVQQDGGTPEVEYAELAAGIKTADGVFRNAYAGFHLVTFSPLQYNEYTGTTYSTNPQTGVAWTSAEVNALNWHVGANDWGPTGSVIRFDRLYFNVTFNLIPPTPTTNAASSVTTTAATLNGTVNPNGATGTYPVSYYYQYGLTAAYGSVTTTVNGLTGSGNFNVPATLSGLTASTTYHFRLVASNAQGSYTGADQSFTTSAGDAVLMRL